MKRQRQYIPINKGHSDLETEERRNQFKKIASEGWETDYELLEINGIQTQTKKLLKTGLCTLILS